MSGNLVRKKKKPGNQKPVAPLTCMGVSLRPLNPKQRLFVSTLFENGFNVKEAATVAGYEKPGVRGSQLLKHPQVSRIVEKIQRKVTRETELNLESVLKELSKAVFRDVRDIVDEYGRPITNLRNLPDRIASVVDSVKETTSYDKEGNESRRSIEYKLVPKAAAIDMALKVTGGYAPEEHEHSVSINWDEHLEPPSDADSVEREIEDELEAEYRVIEQKELEQKRNGTVQGDDDETEAEDEDAD